MGEIEKGVPLPKRGGAPKKHKFHLMEVGDSVFMEKADQNNITALCRYYNKKLGYVYTTQKQWGGVRVWRVS